KLIATDAMANQLFEKEDRTPSQTKEAEALYADIVTHGTSVKDLPKEVLDNAEGNLFEIRNLVIGQAAPEAESNDLDGKAVKLSGGGEKNEKKLSETVEKLVNEAAKKAS